MGSVVFFEIYLKIINIKVQISDKINFLTIVKLKEDLEKATKCNSSKILYNKIIDKRVFITFVIQD